MTSDPKSTDADETPEYPLPSPTDSLSRDQRPPDDESDVEKGLDDDIEADPSDPDIAGNDASGEPS
ncbi:hypothetical protein GIW70_21590 [Pseudomonas syringae]|nr:hypothetical protein [Pseudomonas syringae]MCF5070778.1 hypothetical protein [Pseudomonas syringae]